MTRTCIQCQHFDIDMGHPAYSDVTPGDDARIECMRNHWSMENHEGQKRFRLYIVKAETCPDFEVARD